MPKNTNNIKNDTRNNILKNLFLFFVIALCVICFIKKDFLLNKIDYLKSKLVDTNIKKYTVSSNTEMKVKFDAELFDSFLPDSVNKINVQSVDADTTLISSQGISYSPSNMVDTDLSTSWQDGAEDFGYENFLTFSFIPSSDISFIVIYNGNHRSEDYFKKNNRLKDINIICDNQSVPISLKDTMDPQIIKLSGANDVDSISFEICSVYPGTTYNDTCVAEVDFYN